MTDAELLDHIRRIVREELAARDAASEEASTRFGMGDEEAKSRARAPSLAPCGQPFDDDCDRCRARAHGFYEGGFYCKVAGTCHVRTGSWIGVGSKHSLTPTQQAAFAAGLRHAAGTAQLAALQIELSPDAEQVRSGPRLSPVQAHRGAGEHN